MKYGRGVFILPPCSGPISCMITSFAMRDRRAVASLAQIDEGGPLKCGELASHDRPSRRGRSWFFKGSQRISLIAQARKLVTSGPYAIVRHPLYLVEEVAIATIDIWAPRKIDASLHCANQIQGTWGPSAGGCGGTAWFL
jgi:Isoprenylcysteine carboxyl methyltransferase (ICMT) family